MAAAGVAGLLVAFLAFSWIRGGLDGWYAYDFLDSALDGGWARVLASTGQVLVVFLVVSVLVHAAGNARVALATGGLRSSTRLPGMNLPA